MHYAIEYVECMNISKTTLQQINYVRLKKGVLLPCEVVGAGGKMQTEYYRNINELSPMKWKFNKITSALVTKRQQKIWDEFLKWLRVQNVETYWDFIVEQR